MIWDQEAELVKDPRTWSLTVDHIYVQLSNYLLLREWYDDGLGVLYRKSGA